jgi:hypothetical protein
VISSSDPACVNVLGWSSTLCHKACTLAKFFRELMKANHHFHHPLKPSDGAFSDKNLDFLGEISLEKDCLQRRGNR